MKNESQYGLLLLQRYLYEHTDDQHPASVADILAFWQEHGIQAGRKSVYSAIEVLQSSGMDIVCVKSTQNRYFVGERIYRVGKSFSCMSSYALDGAIPSVFATRSELRNSGNSS